MTRKLLTAIMLSSLLLLALSSQSSVCARQTPEQFVREFYTWYIAVDNKGMNPICHSDIHRYVYGETVGNVQNPQFSDNRAKRDYFLKTLEGFHAIPETRIVTGKATPLGKDFFAIPVTITDELKSQNVIVIVKNVQSSFKITKCIDIYPEL